MGQADYLPVLAAAEIDLLLGPSWPLRPGRALQLVLQELVATGRLRRAEGASPWPLVAVPGAEPPVRWMAASVHRLFLQDGGLPADGFVARMATAFEDSLELSGAAPAGYPERWFSAALSTGLVAEGLVALVEQPGYLVGDKAFGSRTGLELTAQGRGLAGYLRPLQRQPRRRFRRAPERPRPQDGLPFLTDLVADVDPALFDAPDAPVDGFA